MGKVESIADRFVFEGFILVYSMLLSITVLSCSNNYSMIFPLGSVLYHVRL